MTKNRVVAYQWVHESVSNVEIYHFWWDVLKDFPLEVSIQRRSDLLPDNLKHQEPFNHWTIMMDNARVHHHASVIGLMEENGMNCIWNAPYSPQLMPVENLFAMIARFCNENVFKT